MPVENWQSKINDIHKILRPMQIEQKQLSVDLKTVNTANTAIESDRSHWSSPTNVSEHLLDVINYSDYKVTSTNRLTCETIVESNSSPLDTTIFYGSAGHGDTNIDQSVPTNESESNKLVSDMACCSSSIELKHPPEQVLNLMEMAKKNIVKLIDDQIQLIKYKPRQQKQCEQLKQLELTNAIKTVERQDCIQRIRAELTAKMDNLNRLLRELDEKC